MVFETTLRYSAGAGFPAVRMRRARQAAWSRRLVAEHSLSPADFIWPLFILEGEQRREPVKTMAGVYRYSIDEAVKQARMAADLGIPALALFPYTEGPLRNPEGSEATNPDNLVCRAVRTIKDAVPEIGLLCDVALDPYTSHGHDGLMDEEGRILNDATIETLIAQALVQAEAGCDIIAPSDMMDGRIGAIRGALEDCGHTDVLIMAYAAKYASAFYGPFRDAVGSGGYLKGDKKTYQMDPANGAESVREVGLDVSEGADFVMVKPGMPYLDIVQRIADRFAEPVFAYQVSGEFAMIQAAAEAGLIERERAMMESLLAFKRAGARGILTYFAPEAARLLG